MATTVFKKIPSRKSKKYRNSFKAKLKRQNAKDLGDGVVVPTIMTEPTNKKCSVS